MALVYQVVYSSTRASISPKGHLRLCTDCLWCFFLSCGRFASSCAKDVPVGPKKHGAFPERGALCSRLALAIFFDSRLKVVLQEGFRDFDQSFGGVPCELSKSMYAVWVKCETEAEQIPFFLRPGSESSQPSKLSHRRSEQLQPLGYPSKWGLNSSLVLPEGLLGCLPMTQTLLWVQKGHRYPCCAGLLIEGS